MTVRPPMVRRVKSGRFPSALLSWASGVAVVLTLLTGCADDPGSGPVEVKWDRDVCARCNMVLSDRKHAAQVRYTPADRRSQVWLFDDLGCAVLWLDKQPWGSDPAVEIWVNDHQHGNWIDARSARYLPGQITPMEYGLGAQPAIDADTDAETLSFEQARAHIAQIEQRFNVHGAHLEQAAKARAKAPIDPSRGQ